MQPRHALQSAALQFGRDGTDRSLAELSRAMLAYQCDSSMVPPRETKAEAPAIVTEAWYLSKDTFKVHDPNEQPLRVVAQVLPIDAPFSIPATLGEESHSE